MFIIMANELSQVAQGLRSLVSLAGAINRELAAQAALFKNLAGHQSVDLQPHVMPGIFFIGAIGGYVMRVDQKTLSGNYRKCTVFAVQYAGSAYHIMK
ncbi:hypothetical protein D3C73_1190930 [compost metagenome]